MEDKVTTPGISIIVPVYKAEKYLRDCVNSILSQTFTNFELILVNDGSPDNSGAICDSYATTDKRIKVIHKINGGASTARKEGVEAAKGKYIGWVDADDRVAPDMFAILYDLIENYNADIAECQYLMVYSKESIRSGSEEPIVSGNGEFILNEFFQARMKPCFWTKLYKPELFSRVEFPARQIHVDYYVNMLFALMPLKYVRTSETKYYYIVRENSNITTYTSRQLREAFYLYDYTINTAETKAPSDLARKYLKMDAVSRLMDRYFEVSVHSNIKNQKVYNHFLRKKLGFNLTRYLLMAKLPLKTRISYLLTIINMKGLQAYLHARVGVNALNKD